MPRPRTLILATLAVVAAAVATASCRSLSKDEVTERLLDLPKNAALRDAGLERRLVRMRLAGADVDAEIAYVRVPSRSPLPTGKRPVVLVHGTPASLFTWGDVVFGKDGAGGLAAEHEVIVLDVVGHGVTRTAAPDPFTFAHGAEWVAGAIEALEIDPVHLVGNSYGGEFCWRVAADRPDLVRTLTLLDSSGYTRPDDGWLPEETAMREISLATVGWALVTTEKIRGALQPHFPFPVTAAQVAECEAICRNPENWRVMVQLARDENGTRAADIARIARPTLLLWGADDIAFPPDRDASRFARDIRGAELVVLPGVGHYPQETVPDEVVARLADFLRRNP